MTTHTHSCCATECQKQIPLNMLMCMGHWRMVPAPVQREVQNTWRGRLRRPTDSMAINAHETARSAAVAAVEKKQFRQIAAKPGRTDDLFGAP